MDFLVIPAYKPDLTLIHLLQRVKAKSSLHVVVVNDAVAQLVIIRFFKKLRNVPPFYTIQAIKEKDRH